METIKYTKMDIDKIINLLISGGILAFPTDTVFGLACIMDEKAIKKIYDAKERDFNKSLPMMCSDLKMIEKYAHIDQKAKKIINKFTPGALTVVLKKKDIVEDYITNNKDTIAIRVPDDEWILKLIDKLDQPLMVTSANISNQGSLLKYTDVYESMNGKIDGIVCEDARGDKASTIIDLSSDLKLLREGPIDFKKIMEEVK